MNRKIKNSEIMGLDTSHGAWNGSYSTFNKFRRALLKAYNGKDLFDYSGYETLAKRELDRESNLIPIESIEDEGLRILMNHSDCDGYLKPEECILIANSINAIYDNIEPYFQERATEFRDGCLLAFSKDEILDFH